MKGIMFIPGKRLVITYDFGENEVSRMHEIIDIIGTVDIKAIPFRDNIIYGRRQEQTSIPQGKGVFGCIIDTTVFLGNIVIFGIDDQGNDLDCSLDMDLIHPEFEIKIFTKDQCIEDTK